MICTDELKKTMKETSFDSDNKEYMTESTLEVVNFDGLKDQFVRTLNNKSKKLLCSNDALFFSSEDEIFMIEFKNGKIDKNTIYNLFWKNFDSILIYLHYDLHDIKTIKSKLNYILVYNEEKNSTEEGTTDSISQSNSRVKIGQTLASKAKNNFILFGLNYFKGYTFKEVYTLTETEFEELFLKKW